MYSNENRELTITNSLPVNSSASILIIPDETEPDIYSKGKAIVDAKYYKSPLTQNDNFISSHLSQLNLYFDAYNLTNGFLVYPEPDSGQINSENKIRYKKLVVYTIPLNKEIVDLNNALDTLTKSILSE